MNIIFMMTDDIIVRENVLWLEVISSHTQMCWHVKTKFGEGADFFKQWKMQISGVYYNLVQIQSDLKWFSSHN